MTAPPMRPLSFGEIRDGAFTPYRRHVLRFVGTRAPMMAGFIAAIPFLGVAGLFAASVNAAAGRVGAEAPDGEIAAGRPPLAGA